MAIGLTYHPGLTAASPRRAPITLSARVTQRLVAVARVGLDLLAMLGVALLASARPGAWWVWALPVVVVGLLGSNGSYGLRITPSLAYEVRPVLGCVLFPLAALALLKVAGTGFLVETALGFSAVLLTLRGISNRAVRSMRLRGMLADRTLIVGAGQVGVSFSSILEAHPEYGMRATGFLDDVDGEDLPLPLFGGVELLRMVLSEERIDRVVVAFGVTRESQMLETIRACEDASVDIHVLPRFFELGVAVDGKDVDDVRGIPLVRLRRSFTSRYRRVLKRSVDVSLASAGLVLLSPLYGALALLVKLTSPGPVCFRQKRVGQHGTIVEVPKFRTMYVHDGTDVEWAPDESCLTRVGGILRRTGLDELPQLWSVVRGDMSLVGPRPERPFFVERFKTEVPHYDARHRVPVGLTGLAQVHGLRGDTSIDERARFDNRYIESWSLWRDLVILFQTVFAVLRDACVPQRGVARPGPDVAAELVTASHRRNEENEEHALLEVLAADALVAGDSEDPWGSGGQAVAWGSMSKKVAGLVPCLAQEVVVELANRPRYHIRS